MRYANREEMLSCVQEWTENYGISKDEAIRIEIADALHDMGIMEVLDCWNCLCDDKNDYESRVFDMGLLPDLGYTERELELLKSDDFNSSDPYLGERDGKLVSYSEIDDSPFDIELLVNYIIVRDEEFYSSDIRMLLDELKGGE